MGASVDAQMWNGLVGVAKETYTASLGEGAMPRPLMMPLVRGELVGLIWVRPLKVSQDAVAGTAELANIAAAAGADDAQVHGPDTHRRTQEAPLQRGTSARWHGQQASHWTSSPTMTTLAARRAYDKRQGPADLPPGPAVRHLGRRPVPPPLPFSGIRLSR
ncbi:hypothetical protein [Streptomyces sp. WAC 04229]|uniref:hypothetical protein n=1 Tax=Streptomyces sp. WAC 04229 TaxID=2203206 RepID=UPI003D70F966